MGFKCSLPVMGLVKGQPKPGQKHRANGMAFAKEAGIERASQSETLHRDLRDLDVFVGMKSGEDLWNSFCAEADEYRIKGKTKDGKDCERRLGKNTVIGVSVIINPPEEVTLGWTPDQFQKFREDSEDALAEFYPDLFSKKNRRAYAEHGDEGKHPPTDYWHSIHWHEFYIPKDKDGHYCGNKVDGKLLGELNKFYPQFMRSRGWDMDDLDVTDWDRYKTDTEYHAKRHAKNKNNGKSVNDYRRSQERKENQQQAEELADMADAIAAQYEQMYAQKLEMEIAQDCIDINLNYARNSAARMDVEYGKKKKQLADLDHELTLRENNIRTKEDQLNKKEKQLDDMYSVVGDQYLDLNKVADQMLATWDQVKAEKENSLTSPTEITQKYLSMIAKRTNNLALESKAQDIISYISRLDSSQLDKLFCRGQQRVSHEEMQKAVDKFSQYATHPESEDEDQMQ